MPTPPRDCGRACAATSGSSYGPRRDSARAPRFACRAAHPLPPRRTRVRRSARTCGTQAIAALVESPAPNLVAYNIVIDACSKAIPRPSPKFNLRSRPPSS